MPSVFQLLSPNLKKELNITLKLAIPIIFAQLGVVFMAVTDNIMVGRFLGAVDLGASGIANSIAFLIASLAVGGMSVIAPMVSKRAAENDKIGLQILFINALVVASIFCLVLSFISYLTFLNFEIFQQTPLINQKAPSYFLIICASNVPLFLFLALKQFSDGLSRPKVAMVITAFGVLSNLLGNYLLINGIWIFPKLGLNGSALATLITRILMLIVLYLYLTQNHYFGAYFKKLKWKIDTHIIKVILQRSVPGGFQFFFEIAAFSFAIIMMGWISEAALAAHQIAINIASSTYMMATGFSFAGGIRVGEAWGLRSPKGIRMAGSAAYILVFIFMGICSLLIVVLNKFLVGLYIDDPEVIAITLPLLTIAAFFQLSDGLQVVGLGVLRGLADIKLPTILTFVAYWVFSLPLGYFLGFTLKMNTIGIWLGLLSGLTFSAVFLYYRYKKLTTLSALKKRFKMIH